MAAGFFAVRAALLLLYADGNSDTDYTGWVAKPRVLGWGLAALLLFGGAVLTAVFPRPRFRVVSLTVIGCLAAGSVVIGQAQSHSRRDIAPRLVTAVAAVPLPAGAVSAGPVRLEHEGGFAYIGLLSEPQAIRTWQYPDTTATGTCAAVARDFAGSTWQQYSFASPGNCDLYRQEGSVVLSVNAVPAAGFNQQSYVVRLMAVPAAGR